MLTSKPIEMGIPVDRRKTNESVKTEVTHVNAQGATTFLAFAVGLILGMIGWTDYAYSPTTGTIVFSVSCLLALHLEYCGALEEGNPRRGISCRISWCQRPSSLGFLPTVTGLFAGQ